MPKENEVEEMFEKAEDENVNVLNAPLEEEIKPEEVDPELAGEPIKDRRNKRLLEKYQAEREANIALNARLAQIAESKASRETETADYLKNIEKIYGTQSPEAIEATNLLRSALEGVEKRSEENALKRFRQEQAEEREAVKKEEAKLDSMIEDIEDKYGVALSTEQQQGFFKYLARISPKDEDGNVVEYADADAAWEDYSERLKSAQPVNKAKSFASRGMTQSGASSDSKLQDNAMERSLREAGII